jgi:hypothetical protein
LGTEYLVRPLVATEEEKASSDFEPVENGVDEDEGIAMMMLRRVGSFFAG